MALDIVAVRMYVVVRHFTNHPKTMYQPSLFPEQDLRLKPHRNLWKLRGKGILLGTSGYSYDDWVGPFYQRGTRKPQMLEYYQQFFPAVELNYTYYTMPRPSTLFQIRNKAPHMLFSVKAHRSITHDRKATREDWQHFADALSVLADTDQLTSVLFQFPSSFHCTHDNFEYLDEVCEYFNQLKVVLELRHASWLQETTYSYATRRRITIASVDAPALPGLTHSIIRSSPRISYYRLHGRNARNWFTGDNSTRYDYAYTPDEIRGLARHIVELATTSEQVCVFANNHPRGQAIETVLALADALDHIPALAAL